MRSSANSQKRITDDVEPQQLDPSDLRISSEVSGTGYNIHITFLHDIIGLSDNDPLASIISISLEDFSPSAYVPEISLSSLDTILISITLFSSAKYKSLTITFTSSTFIDDNSLTSSIYTIANLPPFTFLDEYQRDAVDVTDQITSS